MRSIASLGLALTTLLMGTAASQPAAAWDDSYARSADVYVHHHVYYPARRIKHVYHVHRAGPYHVHVVYYGATPAVWYNARADYAWRWRGPDRRW